MGQLKLPNGSLVTNDEFHGTIEFSKLVRELTIHELTDEYRIAVIACLSRIGRAALSAISELKKLAEGNSSLIREAAKQAITKIEIDPVTPTNIPVGISPPVPPPPPYSYQRGYNQVKEKWKVDLRPIKINNILDGCITLSECQFCRRIYENHHTNKINKALIGSNRFCRSCMRNKFYCPEITKNLVTLSYRSLIGYIYYSTVQNINNLYITEFKDMIQEHVTTTYSNPLFTYDSDVFNWYVDLEPVVTKKIDLKDIGPTIAAQLGSLGIAEIFHQGQPHLIYQSIMRGFEKGEKFIMPKPEDGGAPQNENGIPQEYLSEFVYSHMNEFTSKSGRKWSNGKKKSEWGSYDNFG